MQNGPVIRNQRAFTRFDVPSSARTEVTVEWAGRSLPGRLRNVSLRGMRISLPEEVPAGVRIGVVFRLGPGRRGPWLTCRGRVAHADPRGIGVDIRDMDGGDFACFRELVAAVSPDPELVDGELREYVRRAA